MGCRQHVVAVFWAVSRRLRDVIVEFIDFVWKDQVDLPLKLVQVL